jgi:hypothetical protein
MHQAELRELLAAAAVDEGSRAWDTGVQTLGDWRRQPLTIAEIPWLAQTVARLRRRLAG